MRLRHLTAVLAVTLLATGGTVAYAEDDPAPDTATTTTAPEPTVTIVVGGAPAGAPKDTDPGPTSTADTMPASTDPAPAATAPASTDPGPAPAADTAPDTTTSVPATTVPATQSATSEPTAAAGTAPTSTTIDATGAAADSAPPTTHNPVQIDSSASAIVNGTQVADADTGNNQVHDETSNPPAAGQQPNAIDTGAADAVGSDDTNVVTQNAQVTLTDQAIANLLQVALILNVGAALANSGLNDAVSTPDGNGIAGAIDSGNATAVGNDMAQYITQAARATGDPETDDAAKQLAVSMWMGLANANSGVNSVTGTGTAGSGGAIGTGDATAIGNQSLTDVLQQAALTGSGNAQVNVAQYATVMNIGFALANSGVNDITGVASGLLTAGDSKQQNQLAVDLFSMLLPALMQSFTGTAGSGTVGTGDATAIGNRSQTYVHQIADAAASGDGIASIVQDVLVANVGAAAANTGGNAIGARYQDLDPASAKAVVTLAAFLSQMLALVHTQSASAAMAMQQQGMDIPFGDIVLQVQGQLQGVDTALSGATGTQANIRQITIILSLGIANSNSGLNRAVGVDQANAIAATVNADPTTGDARAANEGLVIICQRRNAADIQCLRPPEPAPPPSTVPTPPTSVLAAASASASPPDPGVAVAASSQAGSRGGPQGFTIPVARENPSSQRAALPTTGSGVADILLYAGTVTGLGCLLLIATRRRRYAPQHLRYVPQHFGE